MPVHNSLLWDLVSEGALQSGGQWRGSALGWNHPGDRHWIGSRAWRWL